MVELSLANGTKSNSKFPPEFCYYYRYHNTMIKQCLVITISTIFYSMLKQRLREHFVDTSITNGKIVVFT